MRNSNIQCQRISHPCRVGIPNNISMQAFEKRLWTGKIMINFNNTLNPKNTPVYDYVKMATTLHKKGIFLDKLDECIEKEVDKIRDYNLKFMKIIELGILPYCRYENIPYMSKTFDSPGFYDIPSDIQSILDVTYRTYQNDGNLGECPIGYGTGTDERKINISKYNNKFQIIELINEVMTPRDVTLFITRHVSTEKFISSIYSALSFSNVRTNFDISVKSSTDLDFKLVFTLKTLYIVRPDYNTFKVYEEGPKEYTVTIPPNIYNRTEFCTTLSTIWTATSRRYGNNYIYDVSSLLSTTANFVITYKVGNIFTAVKPKIVLDSNSAFLILGFNANSEQTFSATNKLFSNNNIPKYNYDDKVSLSVPDGCTTFGLNPGNYSFNNSILITPDITYLFLTEMSIYTFKVSVILHEFLHFLGMVHTHQVAENNPIGKNSWIKAVIEADFKKGNLVKESIQDNITNRNDPSLEFPQEFDFDSIMTYEISPTWNIENIGIKENYKLSDIDKKGLTTFYGPASKPPGYIPDVCKPITLPPIIPPGNSLKTVENYNYNMSNCVSKKLKMFALLVILFLIILICIL